MTPQTLQTDPAPLIFEKINVMVSFAPKSACTGVVTWFMRHEGLEPAMRYFHSWPHRFRTQVYYRSDTYQRRKETFFSSGEPKVLLRVTRDPALRLVSQYRHCLRQGIVHGRISAMFGINAARDGFSLAEFAHLAGTLDRRVGAPGVDSHLCMQTHPAWSLPFDRVVSLNIDSDPLTDMLNAFEVDVGLPRTDFQAQAEKEVWQKSHHAKDTGWSGADDLFRHRFTPRQARYSFPKTALCRLPQTMMAARALYPTDFRTCRTFDTHGRIAPPPAEDDGAISGQRAAG